MTAVAEVQEILSKLPPESTTFDDIMYEVYVLQKVERSLKSVEKGKTVSFDEAKKRLLER